MGSDEYDPSKTAVRDLFQHILEKGDTYSTSLISVFTIRL